MKRPNEITAKLKHADPELKSYVVELEKFNLKLQKQIAKLRAQNVTYQNEITALKKAPQEFKISLQGYGQEGDKNKKGKN